MRIEPYTVGSYLHVVKRGARGLEIVRDENDKWRFLRSLYFMNDEFFDKNWMISTAGQRMFYRPPGFPAQKPLVDILAYTLMPNHFHLLLRERRENGVSHFMKKLGQSMTNYTNDKYQEQGSIFQGAYRSRTVNSDEYFRYVSAYIMVKNTFELYPHGGLSAAKENFEEAWVWARKYPFSSLADYLEHRETPLLAKGLLGELFGADDFKSYARDVILGGKWGSQLKELE